MTLIPLIAQASGSGCGQLSILMVGTLFIFYFLVIRPQVKDEKNKTDFQSALKVDDQIVTNGGIFGRIVELDGEKLTIEVAPRIRFRIERSAVRQHQADLEKSAASSKADKSSRDKGKSKDKADESKEKASEDADDTAEADEEKKD